MCKDCKNILSCGNCNEKLTTDDKTFSCKKCQIEIKKIPRCNKCGGLNIFSPGTTIKKTIKELLAIFPKINIAEVSKNNPNVKNLKNADIIIGTTALKNINFNNFESLIILYPETFINMPGYNSDSKALYTLSILKEKLQNNKKLLIKTSESKNNVIRHLISGKYSNFYKEKSGELKDYGYPPYKDIIRIKIKEKDNKKLLESEIKIKKHLRKYNLISEYEEKNKNYFIKTIIFKSMKNKLFYDTILKSFKNITIERNPNKGI
jgi:primosomal protein N' (replication factor Y)